MRSSGSRGGRRQWCAVAIPLGLALAMAVITAVPAAADIDGPSAHDVRKAKAEARQRAQDVGSVKAKLARANAELQRLYDKAETAVEKYNGERVRLNQATERYHAARRHLRRAAASLARARTDVGQLAAQAYRTGGEASAIASLFGAHGPQDVIDRTSTIRLLARRRTATLAHMRSSEVVATVLREQAHQAYVEQQRATRRAAAAKRAAKQAVAEQNAQVKKVKTTKRKLEAELAKAQAHATTLEQQRQAALERARERRLAAERRAAARRAAEEAAAARASHGSSGGSTGPASTAPSADAGVIAANWALTQLGKPYVWAAAGPDAYDCSGLTMRAWQHAGVYMVHYAASQYYDGPHIPLNDLQKGDLVFFAHDTSDPSTIHHVGIYIGNGEMVEAPHTGAVVRISSIWRPDLIGATRPE